MLLGFNRANALEKDLIPLAETATSVEPENANPFGIVIEPSEETLYKDNEKSIDGMSMQEIFGDEQIYPFEQGLGGHGGATAK